MSRSTSTLIRRFSTPQPRVFVMLVLLLILLLAVFGTWEYRAHKHQLANLLREEAIQVSRMVSLSGERVMQASREWEQQLTGRLLDKAQLLDLVERERELTTELLEQLMPDSSGIRVIVFAADGRRIFPPEGFYFSQEHSPPGPGFNAPQRRRHFPGRIPPALTPVLTGEQQMQIIGLHNPRILREHGFSLAYHRSRGGAFLLNVDVAHLQRQHQRAGIVGLMQRIQQRPNVAWIGFYDHSGLLESNCGAFPPLEETPPLRSEQAEYRQMIDSLGHTQIVLDVTVPLQTPFMKHGLLRIGFTGDRLNTSRGIYTRSLLIRSGFFLLIGLLLLYYFLVYSNYRNLAREYDGIREEVERLEQEKQVVNRLQAMGELASGVAHEIRNPLNSIRMIGQRLRLEFDTQQNEEYRGLTRVVQEEADRINRIITDFLQFARPAPLRLETNSLSDCITQTADGLRPSFESANCKLKLTLSEAPVFEFDFDRMSQVFHNLLANALHAVERDGLVAVDVSHARGTVHITITDNGRGIKPADLDRVFNLYFTTRPEGSGVGLAVTHQIISEHGGSIRVESTPGEGTTFIIDIPKQQKVQGKQENTNE
ncbi:hypothetical protein K8R42_02750 [bacterium]|nr:hypothetical protein [bacterium]